MVVLIMAVLTSLLIPNFQPNIPLRLQATAEVVAADIALVRSLAAANASTYEITFDPAGNQYYFENSSGNSALDALPSAPFNNYTDANTRRTTRLGDLPSLGQPARLANVYAVPASGSPTAVTTLEFGPLGQTTRSEPTVLWLESGEGAAQCFQSITVDPVTGLTTIGEVVKVLPSGMMARSTSNIEH